MLSDLKHTVYLANKELVNFNLVIFTWGNVSGYDPAEKLMVIKPSGVNYDEMTPEQMVVVDLEGNVVEGRLKPSSDTPSHLELYRNFKDVRGIVHTHSEWATSWAQAGRFIPAFGTTHADYFHGDIPCTRYLRKEEVTGDYELNTGKVIVETFKDIDPLEMPAVLVAGHGPFAWGDSPQNAVHNAVVMEQVARMAYRTIALGNNRSLEKFLLDKHFERKHGKDAYYGQT
ncbi:MAG TPA: L-ribulose-5-phosphate 4-epimerase [Bacteroidales bacterium]|nr:L-ribulose-5-phosphate 4-epimerase [Bacteroidales bacterium]